MGKVLKGVAIAAAFVAIGVATGGIGWVPAMTLPATGATIGGSLVIASSFGAALAAMAVSSVLSGVSSQFFGPKNTKAGLSRLTPTLDPQAYRKFVVGETAMNTDVRYFEPSGTNQEYIDYIIATSAHEVESIDEIWFDDRLAWSSSSGVQSFYSGYLTVNTRTVGTSANYIPINGGWVWGASARLTGCSYVHLRLKRTGNTKAAESPLVNGLPSRVTIKGKGAKLYDPRLDSTVAGGSGAMRANNQATWGTANSTNRDNPALQLLWFLLGWNINGKLSVGCGIPPARLDLPSFITAANICDEAIALAAGGTQPRYRTAGVGSDADNRMEIIQILLTAMNGTLRDVNGKMSLVVMKNDLATPVLSLNDNDILGDFNWNQTRGLDETMNAVHGKYTDPSNNSLYQPVEYPVVSLTSIDGIERMQTLDLPWVQDGNRAQRIAKQVLQRAQYKGIFTASFSMKALGCEVGDIVNVSFEPLGWANKPFRVINQQINASGQIPMTLIEENAAIYAWDRNESAVVTPTAPTVYDPLNSPYILAAAQASETANWSGVINDNGARPENNATVGANWNTNLTSRPTELTDGRVSAAINGSGNINSGRVLTSSIASNAVSKITAASGTSSFNINSSWTTLQTVVVTTDGGPLIIRGTFLNFSQPIAAGTHGISFKITSNGGFGTQNYDSIQYAAGGGSANQFRQACTLEFVVASLGAGTYTINLEAILFNTNSQAATLTADRLLSATELKR